MSGENERKTGAEAVRWPRRPPRPRRSAADRVVASGTGPPGDERRSPVSRHGQIVVYDVSPSAEDQQ